MSDFADDLKKDGDLLLRMICEAFGVREELLGNASTSTLNYDCAVAERYSGFVEPVTMEQLTRSADELEAAVPRKKMPGSVRLNYKTMVYLVAKVPVAIKDQPAETSCFGCPFYYDEDLPDGLVRVFDIDGDLMQEIEIEGVKGYR